MSEIEHEERKKELQGRIIRDSRALVRLDPWGTDEFLQKLEKKLWEARIKEAGKNEEKLERLLQSLYARANGIRKRLSEEKKEREQRRKDAIQPQLNLVN